MLGIVFLVIFLAFLVNFFRQVTVYYWTSRQLAKKQKELKALEEKNRALQVRLEEVQSPKFVEEQARKLLGMGDNRAPIAVAPSGLPKTSENMVTEEMIVRPNYRQWWQLFIHDEKP